MSKKLFISLPMRGHSDDAIRSRRDWIYELAMNSFVEKYELIDTLWQEPCPNESNRLWYLGKSIQALGEADLVIFATGWANAKGCIIERMICDIYGINKIEEKDLNASMMLDVEVRNELGLRSDFVDV